MARAVHQQQGTLNAQFPSFYNPANAGKWDYRPNARSLFTGATDYRQALGIKPAASDRFKIHVLGIDVQKDFGLPEGTLYVGGRSGTGAIDDTRRTAEFIYRNMDVISAITPTMDTHFPLQIFSPSFWLDDNGQPVLPHDQITDGLEIMRMGKSAGKATPNPAVAALANGNYSWLVNQAKFYCKELAKGGKYQLYIWPEHTLLGSGGHALVGLFEEARLFHAFVRMAQSEAQIKGGNPFTENYSVFGAEVLTRHDGKGVIASKNMAFIRLLLEADAVVTLGQAGSHCLKSSTDDLLGEILAQDPTLAKKVYVLRDCTSAVAVPNPAGGFFVDYTTEMEAALARYEAAGMHVVNSTDPIRSWPGIQLD